MPVSLCPRLSVALLALALALVAAPGVSPAKGGAAQAYDVTVVTKCPAPARIWLRYHVPKQGAWVTHAWAQMGAFETTYLGATGRDYYSLYAETDPISHSITSDISKTVIQGNAQTVKVAGQTYGLREMRAEGGMQKLACSL